MLSRFVACSVCALAFAVLPAAGAEQLVKVLTGSARGAYYPLGIALADNIGKTLKVRTSVEATKGPVECLGLLQSGKAEIAFALGDSLSDAWKGREEAGFRTPLDKLRGVAAIYPSYIQIVVRADSGIKTLADLRGKRISVGPRKSPIELNARTIFAAAGLSYSDLAKTEYLPLGESIELIKEGQIDGMLQSAALGTSTLRDLAKLQDIVVVPIPAEVIHKAADPAYIPAVIPANTYRGQATDVPTAAVQNYLVTNADVSAEVVYGMTSALWTGLDLLVAAHPEAKAIDFNRALDGMPVPLHPGAEKYYKEMGLIR
jgi:TRAP transporter TAXI family solute receptor